MNRVTSKADLMETAARIGLGQKQEEIAEVMGRSQSAVSRRVANAIKAGFLSSEKKLVQGKVDDEILAKIKSELEYSDLAERLRYRLCPGQPKLRTVVIAPNVTNRTDAESLSEQASATGQACADWMSLHRSRMRVVGLTWGRSVQAVARCVSPSDSHGNLSFVPLCGEPIFSNTNPQPELSATSLAEEFARRFGGRADYSLRLVPNSVPYDFNEAERETLYKYFEKVVAYKAVFGQRKRNGERSGGAIESLDTILTGLGGVLNPWPWLKDRAVMEGLSENEWSRFRFGDMGGWLFPNKAFRRQIDRLNARWLGITLGDYQRTAKYADSRDLPGVIIVASGEYKVDVLEFVIKQCRCVNRIVIDLQLARALASRIDVAY